ncbi:hypothetical protein [Hyphomonas jannaschiana]|uniref:Uncharacterized protein n=1 Tax=Hyphomonas jannaschiana VP2 TaxID=1280952 RepID=A0A059FDA3_9PROT|nr:hypothetical protein [Hyphomonas jannaschiana]KCZ88508.1 hypothetical protein HJA_09074 [Hyphomonas jannaschiana VP2]
MADEDPTETREAKLAQRRARVEYFAFIAQIVSAIAIVISLVFVGIQLHDGNTVTLRNESNATMTQWSAFRASIYSDRDTAEVFRAGMSGAPPLDATDQLRFGYIMREHAWATFQIWDRAKRGLVPSANFEAGAAPDYLKVICTPGGSVVWAGIRSEMPAPFVADMDRIAQAYAPAHHVSCIPEE